MFVFFFLVLRGTDNDMKEGVCMVSCEKVNKMIERIDAMDKKLDKLLAKDCKGTLKLKTRKPF